MTESKESPVNPDEMPFVAPCRKVPWTAPWYWLSEGFADLRKAPRVSLSFGIVMAAMIMFVVSMAWNYGSVWILFSMLCGFIFIAPLTSIGIYAISAQIERNQPVTMRRSMRTIFKRNLGTALVFALVLLIIFILWARATTLSSVFLPEMANPSLSEMALYITAGTLVATLFLGITFSASIFALPMIMHRDVDAITAVLTSISAVRRNKGAMLSWVVLILSGFIISIATAGLGLIIFLPAVGHGVWHGYLDTIDAQQFPRHEAGITAIPRADRSSRPRFRFEKSNPDSQS